MTICASRRSIIDNYLYKAYWNKLFNFRNIKLETRNP